MNLTAAQLIPIVGSLLLLEGLFSGSELALLSSDRLLLQKLAKKGNRGARLALELSLHPERILAATLLVTSGCVVAITVLIELYFSQLNVSHSELRAILVTSPLIVFLGELIPKTLFKRFSDRVAPWISFPVTWAYWGFFPITRLLAGYSIRISRVIGPIEELLTGKRRTSRDDLEALLSYERSESELQSGERQTIKRILDFRETQARHAMIPLFKVDGLEDTAKVRGALESFKSNQHTRMPVYRDRVDDIFGIIEVHDLIATTDLDLPIKNFVTPAHFVSETQALEDILFEMRRDQDHMVVVVDEHGGAVGVLTFEDIVEEIVGEISDEYDHDVSPFKELSPGKWLLQSRMEITLINEELKIALPEGEYETLGGFLLQQFGKIPETRDELYFSTLSGSFRFTIRHATERQILSVFIEQLEGSPEL